MKLSSLKLENFRQHENSFIEFNDGITIISGENGSGKSTVLEAICWIIYGLDAVRGTKDSILWNKAPAKSKVRGELNFSLDGEIYKIIRTLDKAEVYINDVLSASSTGETTKYLTEKLGMTLDEFYNTYFTRQKELNFLKTLKPIERRKFISHVLGYDKIKQAQEKVRTEKNNLLREIEGFKQGLENIEEIIKEKALLIERINEAKKELTYIEKNFKDISLSLAEIEPKWDKIKNLKQIFEDRTLKIQFLKEKIELHNKTLEKNQILLKEFEEKSKKLKDFKNIEEEYKNTGILIKEQEQLQEIDIERKNIEVNIKNLKERSEELKKELDIITISGKEKAEQVKKIQPLDIELIALKKELKEQEKIRNDKIKEKEVLISQNEKELQKLIKQYEDLMINGEDGNCPTCKRSLKGDIEHVKSHFEELKISLQNNTLKLKDELNSLKKEYGNTETIEKAIKDKEIELSNLHKVQFLYEDEKNRWKSINQQYKNVITNIEEFTEKLKILPIGFDSSLLTKLRIDIEPLRLKYNEKIRIEAELSGYERLKNDTKEIEKNIDDENKKVIEFSNELNNLEFSTEEYIKTEKNYHELKEKSFLIKSELLEKESFINNLNTSLKLYEDREKIYYKKANQIKEKLEHSDYLIELDKFYGELWERLNNEARPELSEIASEYLSELTDQRYSKLELNEKYDIKLFNFGEEYDGDEKTVISGGEEDISNLCLRLSISQLIAQRSGKSLSLLILDEVFGSLDENRRNNVVQLLNSLIDSFEQVILITHIDDIKENVTNVIKIEYDENRNSSIISSL